MRSPFTPFPSDAGVVGHGLRDTGRVIAVVTSQSAHGQCTVGHGLGERPYLVERRSKRHEPVPRNASIRWLESDAAAKRCRLADRSTRVATERRKRFVGSHSSRAATARTAGNTVKIPRIAGYTPTRVLGGTAHRKLVHVRAPEQNCARVAEPLHHKRVINRCVALEDLGGTGTGLTIYVDHILDRNRNTAKKFAVLRDPPAVDRVGLRKSIICIHPEISFQFAVNGLNAIEKRLRRLARGNVAAAQLVAELINCQRVETHEAFILQQVSP